jgi:hypothetical protein
MEMLSDMRANGVGVVSLTIVDLGGAVKRVGLKDRNPPKLSCLDDVLA